MTAPLIVVVDDEEPIRKLLTRFLSRRGYLVETAENGAEGFELVDSRRPDLVISDIDMPIMDGVEMISKLRSTGWGQPLPVLLLTATKGLGDDHYQTSSGADAFILKPVSMANLLSTIQNLLARDQVQPSAFESATG